MAEIKPLYRQRSHGCLQCPLARGVESLDGRTIDCDNKQSFGLAKCTVGRGAALSIAGSYTLEPRGEPVMMIVVREGEDG